MWSKIRIISSVDTIIVFGREKPQEWSDAFAVLRTIEVIAPPIESPVPVGMVTRKRVFIQRTGLQRGRRDDPRHVDVG